MDPSEEKDATDLDKHVEVHEEFALHDGYSSTQSNTVDGKKLMRKIDWAILPWISLLYLLSFLDRTSIGNARVC